MRSGGGTRAVADIVDTLPSDDFDAEELYRLHYERLRAHCSRLLGDATEAADIAQEAIIRAWMQRNRLRDRGPQSLRPWLWTVATRLCIDAARRRSRLECGDVADRPSASDDPITYLERHDDRLAVQRALGELSDRHRAALVLRDVEELDYEEVASRLAMSVGAARVLLFRARARLRACVEDARAGAWSVLVWAGLRRARRSEAVPSDRSLATDIALRALAAASVVLVAIPSGEGPSSASGGTEDISRPPVRAPAAVAVPDAPAPEIAADSVPDPSDSPVERPRASGAPGTHVAVSPDGARIETSVPAPGDDDGLPVGAWAERVDDGDDSAVLSIADEIVNGACRVSPAPCDGIEAGVTGEEDGSEGEDQ